MITLTSKLEAMQLKVPICIALRAKGFKYRHAVLQKRKPAVIVNRLSKYSLWDPEI